MENYLPLLFGLGIAVIVAWWLMKMFAVKMFTFLVNSVMGTAVIFLANRLFEWSIPLNLPVLLVCAIFGLPGSGAILILYFFDMVGHGPAPYLH